MRDILHKAAQAAEVLNQLKQQQQQPPVPSNQTAQQRMESIFNANLLLLSSNQQQSQQSTVNKLLETFQTESQFSCFGKPSGYYESEWCNVFYRCVDGKRIDTRCGTGGSGAADTMQYDLWWEHQNVSYDPYNPVVFLGPDDEAKCEWPCRVKCNKKIWIDKGKSVDSSVILNKDKEIHFDCSQQTNLNSLNRLLAQNYNQNKMFIEHQVGFIMILTHHRA